ncbi:MULTISPECIES: tRNA uridine-5-carboxymethylaminomethyl(34) synthesis GTPase MnmE [unclassified Acidovorax]|uniref:tRNA uridine-5-carboxymethylaminomethyl(34) synthesis GTPase MnmE n=1 Tax=unclassified Acidovorax TaxID=2684926 RepID=UPI001C48ED82|nr:MULTISPECIES: tRNA uridine-5-carboxymethylaminomethyl(34) synthesis GTPase MnmE [unclassified Acidovorax]MBV7429848.1 tRNA uridine-5-carboxymethylaminomethyl(34) synthesis GTPase MnmE [Acidovorax sp. sif0732]MBV7448926.1 tRNA uridine-5-carboxymethylaminomethyl(34) synthesis GTPase MnmE [Acidovorax sp. sif0715]
MLARHHDPIVAIATAPGRGAVGIVRVSGRAIGALVQALCGRALKAREATYLPFRDVQGQAIDQGLALYFPGPHSYTGEDVLELQAHGGPVVLQLLLARCLEAGAATDPATGQPCLPGLRVAQPGEFTERAFLNDKIDLAQAEAIADLIDASTEAAARSASRSLTGAFSAEIHALRDALIHLRMLVEATLDFPEEEIDFLRKADAHGQLSKLQQTLASVMQRARQGALLREGIKVVIAGQPNAGKSSLLNALAGAELAIVTPIAGTTRDKVQQTIQIEGVPLHIIDTAGLRDSSDEVERIGIARAWDEIAGADAVLFLHDLERADAIDYIAADAGIESALAQKLPGSIPVIDVWNKLDRAPRGVPGAPAGAGARPGVRLSARTGEGLDSLRRLLLEVAGWQSAPEGIYIARARHVQALQAVGAHLQEAADQLQAQGPALDLLAEELRLAQNALSAITGEFSSDDLLGVIFSSFCIGK